MVIGSLSQRELIQPNRAAIDARRLKSWNVVMEGWAHNGKSTGRVACVCSRGPGAG